MLVIGHQDETVGVAGKPRVVVALLLSWHRQDKLQSVRAQSAAQLLDQRRIVGLGRSRKPLEVQHQPSMAAADDIGMQRLDERRSRRTRSEHVRRQLAIPALVMEVIVVDERQQLEGRCIGADPLAHQRLLLRVVAYYAAVGCPEMQPLHDHRVEVARIALQRGKAVVVPVDEMRVALGGVGSGAGSRTDMPRSQQRLIGTARRQAMLGGNRLRQRRELVRRQVRTPETGHQHTGSQHYDPCPSHQGDYCNDYAAPPLRIEEDWPLLKICRQRPLRPTCAGTPHATRCSDG